ncbi:LysM peptidoglycan-binding domain-containing protein [Clostridium grantii]|uniref:LysM domain-containing protein n=1 Tax=Clostridium grantii DSM 8605 TaxID=1121316 RepID=A0A1M5WTM3_9CLOT|nr:LysM domain-containing protein [Clostridium grantii]SHH90798.1 LysM domain-containing protein [Clostridium grantii DSM 8605]
MKFFKKPIIIICTLTFLIVGLFFIYRTLNYNKPEAPIQNAMEAKDNTLDETDISNNTDKNSSKDSDSSAKNSEEQKNVAEDEYIEYLVKEGDSLYSIATTQMSWSIYNSALRMLTEINNIRETDVLKIGSKILIPQNQINTANTIPHIINKGDTLYSLAIKYLPSTDPEKAVKIIMDKNNITNEKELNIGLNIYIPDEATTTTSTTEKNTNYKSTTTSR